MSNKEINKQLVEIARAKKKKHYYKRIGRCDPGKCGGACCRYVIALMHEDGYFSKVTGWLKNPIQTVKYGKGTFVVTPFHCPNITIGGRCKLHGKKTQPLKCDCFPMKHDDAMYKYVQQVCSYRFEKTLIEQGE